MVNTGNSGGMSTPGLQTVEACYLPAFSRLSWLATIKLNLDFIEVGVTAKIAPRAMLSVN